ncbi:MAG: MBL fold metallo-hydrolase [Actinomycetota bacterium]|nr:MBL fold metallo-hydrolase [Actinomycetota bacterium]
MLKVTTIETPELGDRSYLVHDGTEGLVVDPQRDIERVLKAAADAGVRIAAVAETHMHNDYVTGGLALARKAGAEYLVSADDEVRFERAPVADGDEVKVGSFTVKVVATPGHTENHVSFVVSDGGEPFAAFTGGSLLYGTVGRPDLVSPELTEQLARSQHRSAHRLGELPGDVELYPTHGFGSFCSASQDDSVGSSTIGRERKDNIAFQIEDEDRFIESLLAALAPYPSYYAHMGEANLAGPEAGDLPPVTSVDSGELRRRLERGEWVIDLRSRRAFATKHLRGEAGFELSSSFVTYLGWIVPWNTPITLVGETQEDVRKAQRDLSLIGFDAIAGAAVGAVESLAAGAGTCGYRVATFADLAGAMKDGDRPQVVDVRRRDEWVEGHIAGSQNIPIHEVADRVSEVPATGPVWVHCAGGFRASIAASLLDRAGKEVVMIDDSFDNAKESGLELTR